MNARDDEPVAGRMLSVDVARGVAIAGMILVNAAAYFHYVAPAPLPFFLLHADWEGFRLADFVFPAFIYIVGVSIPLSLGQAKLSVGEQGRPYRRIAWRSLKLFLLGVVLSNLYAWYSAVDLAEMRYFGVLQRIAVVYFVAALLFLRFSARLVAVIAGLILAAYTAFLYAPLPTGEAADLSVKGLNIVSWVDRTLLGGHAFYDGAAGYDPEGLLSTLPAIAQCLIGALAGHWLAGRERSKLVAAQFGFAGLALTTAGALIGLAHPIVKDLWTGSYVLLSTGVTMLILAASYRLNDVAGRYGPVSHFFRVFGANAIAVYVLHFAASFLIVAAPFVALYALFARFLPDALASLGPVLLFVAMNWLVALWLWRRRIFIKI
ncbi:MAG: DUF5009 domain-containing protein [Amphiplicatus sp.]